MVNEECLGPYVSIEANSEALGKKQIPDDLYPFWSLGNPSRPCADVTISLRDAKHEYALAIERMRKASEVAAFWHALIRDSRSYANNTIKDCRVCGGPSYVSCAAGFFSVCCSECGFGGPANPDDAVAVELWNRIGEEHGEA